MIDTKALRNKVLDLAIQGKLTEQLESDGTAEELFAQIQEEKQRLIKEGKIKKEKPLPPVDDEEIPFEIPRGWKWVRFANIVNFHLGKTPARGDSSYWNNGLYNWITISDMPNSGHISTTNEKISQKAVDDCFNCGITKASSLIMSFKLSIGKVAILDFDAYHNEAIITIIPYIDKHFVFRDFLFLILPFVSQITESHGAIKGETLNKTSLSNMVLPLPPLAEQKRIVERVEEIFKLLDIIDEAQAKYSADAETLKSKLITMGIQGKLTEQLESDGTAEELFAQIQEEKQTILQSRKGRKDNSIIPIDSKTPFVLPKNWKWIRFGETGFFRKGPFGSSLTKSIFVPKGDNTIKVYEQQHAIQKNSTLGTYYITKEYFESSMSGFEVCAGDIIVSCAGTIGETYIMPDNIEKGIINQALMRITLAPSIDKRFFLYYFNSNLKQDAQSGNGSAITNIPPFEIMKNWYFPLPPLAEQKRIADKLDDILRVIG